ncbi:hypothetical protein PtB15_7B139 [Puccinia triticina]|nr:hypothetical protein PtB15_7B139 [Puccinia triticina]
MDRSRDKCRRKASASSSSSSSSTTNDEALFGRRKKQAGRRSSRRLTIEEAVKKEGSNFINFNPFQAGQSGDPVPKKKTAAGAKKPSSKAGRRKTFHGTGCSSQVDPALPEISSTSGAGPQSFTQQRFPPRSPFVKQATPGQSSSRPSFTFYAFDPLSPIQPSDNQGWRQTVEPTSSSDEDTVVDQKRPAARNAGRRSTVERAVQAKNSNFIDFNPFQAGTPSAPISKNRKSAPSKLTRSDGKHSHRRRTVVGRASENPSSSQHTFSDHGSSPGKPGPCLSGQTSDKQEIGHHGGNARASFPQSTFIKELPISPASWDEKSKVSPLAGSSPTNIPEPHSHHASHPTRTPTSNNPFLTADGNPLLDPAVPSVRVPWKYYPPLPVLSPNFLLSGKGQLEKNTRDS